MLMKADISIIVPIYKGKKYVPYWLDVVEKNAVQLNTMQLRCELILVNDYPEEKVVVKEQNNRSFTLRVLNSYENRGIHGARVYGLEHAEGDWVVFLDQDDRITDDYLVKQKRCIGDADGAICNGFINYCCKDISNVIYVDSDTQKITKDLSYYLATGNPIASPGQVLLKRKAISNFWHQHILKENGADDYFLWILMLKEGKEFALNDEKLYVHVGHESNVSNDISAIARSVYEFEEILDRHNLLSDKEKEIIKGKKVWGIDRPRSADIIAIYDYWMYLEHRKLYVADYLWRQRYYKIGIYGMGSLGNRLYDFLADSNIETIFAVDKRAKKFICKVPVFCLEDIRVEDYMKQVDAIIVTVAVESDFEVIKMEIMKKFEVPVLSLKQILLDMIGGMNTGYEENEM